MPGVYIGERDWGLYQPPKNKPLQQEDTEAPVTTTTTTTTTTVPFEGNNGSWNGWGESSGGGYSETYTLITIN